MTEHLSIALKEINFLKSNQSKPFTIQITLFSFFLLSCRTLHSISLLFNLRHLHIVFAILFLACILYQATGKF
ncbi:hypothetical protein QVD17_24560 [Tagetes erecta]|uniref:Uncharacterized protein n=1 Tax=Tagetes erecta TaxID=13708 RepID=A0AAD8KLQ4_TARER|nr:hypothetical protein QVD17_24560 [Tagetes erecta]